MGHTACTEPRCTLPFFLLYLYHVSEFQYLMAEEKPKHMFSYINNRHKNLAHVKPNTAKHIHTLPTPYHKVCIQMMFM